MGIERGLYCHWHHSAGLVTRFPSESATWHRVNTKELAQRYFYYGIPAAFLSSFAGASQDACWLKLAQDFLQASRYCREDVYRRPQSGKLGWGAAWTYRLTRDPKDAEIAVKVHEGLAAAQQLEGWWPQQNVYGDAQPAALTPSLDLTGKLIAHLSWIESSLGARFFDA